MWLWWQSASLAPRRSGFDSRRLHFAVHTITLLRRVFRKDRAIPAPPSEAGQRAEAELLQSERHDRKVNLVEVLVEEHGDLKQRTGAEPRHADTAILLQTEEDAETLLASPRWAELDQEVCDLAADVSQTVGRARRDDDDVALANRAPDSAQPEEKLARDTLEPLPLPAVHVRRNEPAGLYEELGADAAGRALAKDDALPGDGIRDRVYAFLDHSL